MMFNLQKEPDVANMIHESQRFIIRMTAEDRQTLNRIIQHKREEFEAVIQKGVVAMLNAQEEHNKLAAQRADYLSFLTNRNKQKKAQVLQFTQAAKDATNSAPMGIGTAANITLEAANALNNTILDSYEEKRQQSEAEQNLYSAQMLYYIPSQDYEIISQRVASILSYRYQFLILRLAAGENGYMKLAGFFVNAMKTFAIARLREQKNNVVRALINAAIPPSSDSLSYRDWPSIDFANFRLHLSQIGTRKTLELDEDVNHILRRCGPAVRSLLGGLDSYILQSTGKKYAFKPYTIIGALNHAPILNTEKRINFGLQPKHRKNLTLDGNSKYPLILIGNGETTADLGVNFATKSSNEILEEAHIEVLRRLVPDFFLHQSVYHLKPISHKTQSSPADLRYPEEKFECPWTAKRQNDYEKRLQLIYGLISHGEQTEELECYDDSIASLITQNASQEFNLEYKKEDAQLIKKQTLDAIQSSFDSETNMSHPLYLSKYAAYAAKAWIACMNESQIYLDKDLENLREVLESANLALFASRSHPTYETEKYTRLLEARKKSFSANEQIFQIQQGTHIYYSLMLNMIDELPSFDMGSELIARENIARMRLSKNCKLQINDSIQHLLKMKDVSFSIAYYNGLEDTSAESIDTFYTELKNIHDSIERSNPKSADTIFLHIELCFIEIKIYSQYVREMLLSDKVDIKDKITTDVLHEIENIEHTATKEVESAKEIYKIDHWLTHQQHQKRANLNIHRARLIEQRNIILDYKNNLEYSDDLTPVKFFKRACIQADFKIIHHLSSLNKGYDAVQFRQLYSIAKKLHIQLKKQHHAKAEEVYNSIKLQYSKIPREMNLADIRAIARDIRRNKDNLELEVRDDTEITDIIANQLQFLYREAERSLQDILDIESKLKYIHDNCPNPSRTSNRDDLNLEISNDDYFNDLERKLNSIYHYGSSLLIDGIRDKMMNAFRTFKSQKSAEKSLDIRYLAIQYFASVLKNISESNRIGERVDAHINTLQKNLELAQNIIEAEPVNIRIARKQTIKILKQAYQINVKANQNQSLITSNRPQNWKFSSDTLNWAQHLNVSEQKWLDGKTAQKARQFLEQSREQKPPIRIAFSLILTMTTEQLYNKKTDLCQLKKIQTNTLKTKLSPLSLESESTSAEKEKFEEQKKSLLNIISQKIQVTEDDIDNLEKLLNRDKIIEQTKRLFFNDWKSKSGILHTEKLRHEDGKKSSTATMPSKHEKVEAHTDLEERQYSIDELERWLGLLKQTFCKYENVLSPKPFKSGLFSNGSSSDGLNSEELKIDNLGL
ncbi:MAG: hypothetical protein EBQ95_02580 [Gammaproteobacteria bacterium]|nr:hypothetical protein [Gammaproteobacteria bacterium]